MLDPLEATDNGDKSARASFIQSMAQLKYLRCLEGGMSKAGISGTIGIELYPK
jgi:hypothetical protein